MLKRLRSRRQFAESEPYENDPTEIKEHHIILSIIHSIVGQYGRTLTYVEQINYRGKRQTLKLAPHQTVHQIPLLVSELHLLVLLTTNN